MDYTQLASQESIDKTVAALKERGFNPVVVNTKEEALAKVKELIPAGASVMNGASVTLQEIGFVDHLKGEGHGWDNLHKGIVEEKDADKQKELRRQALTSDYYAGSVHALSETGEMLIASNTGSQLPHIVYSSPNVVFVVGAQKIVPTLADTYLRLMQHVVPLEDARMKQVYGPQAGTAVNKVFVYHKENVGFTGRQVHVVLVKEKLGF
ncbi:MAG TPA: lactate utilization protein [Candidatus Paceibacterota bacterium]|jgi:L-lactate utilization protein LutB|nr:lactate utilization protein [Candidatus Paceibacterota bacterium]